MPRINRRSLLGSGAGIVGATALGACSVPEHAAPAAAAAVPPITGSDNQSGGADLNKAQPHLFHLGSAPVTQYDGGAIAQANEETFPILTGQQASISFTRLAPGGIREPHWHPSAWEVNYVISGTAQWTVLEPQGYHELFIANAGDLVFLPQGSFHYFENQHDTDDLTVLTVFNSSAQETKDDIGIVAAMNSLPRDVLGAVFGVPPSVFGTIPQSVTPVIITARKP
jgi:oxalate decarboxylase